MVEAIPSHPLSGAKSSKKKSKRASSTPSRVDTSIQSKKRIVSAFSKDVQFYQDNARQQQKSAEELSKMFGNVADGELLEIGCGTGFLTGEIMKRYPGRELTAIDLSDEMASFCKRQFPQVRAIQGDGEQLNVDGQYGAIFSGMCLHWFTNLKKSLGNIRKALKKGGVFYFSFPNNRSYPEWNYFPLNPLIQVGTFLEEFGNVHFKEIEFRKTYESPLGFLHEMKKLGTSAKIRLDQNNLKDLIKVAKCGKMNPITITTRITIGYCYV